MVVRHGLVALCTLLHKYGFHDVWESQGVENTSAFLREFTNRVRDTFVTEWDHDLNNSSKLTLYKQLKPDGIIREEYLHNVTLVKYL